jgi:hypothetical protein
VVACRRARGARQHEAAPPATHSQPAKQPLDALLGGPPQLRAS